MREVLHLIAVIIALGLIISAGLIERKALGIARIVFALGVLSALFAWKFTF